MDQISQLRIITPLCTSENDHLDVIKYLHTNGADITTDNFAIKWASYNAHLEVVKYLHENRINYMCIR